jgi:putative transposase
LRKKLWGGHIWSPSYYVGTAGHVSAETIKRYIEEQKSNSST